MAGTTDLSLGPSLDDGDYGDLIIQDSISIREIAGREGTDTVSGGTASISWLVKGSQNPIECRDALVAAEAASLITLYTYDGLFLDSLARERNGPDSWIFTANYNATTPNVGEYTVSIDTTGAQIVQTQSLAQTKYNASGKTGPVYNGAIDVQDGVPQGVERIIPALKINIKAKIATEYLGSPIRYSKVIAGLTGTVNNAATFPDGSGDVFEAGELLFAGATGEVVAKNPTLTFIFLASKNITGGTFGGVASINKKGHEYLWYLFDYAKDATTGLLVPSTRAVYVDQIYGTADHSLLKIGEAPT